MNFWPSWRDDKALFIVFVLMTPATAASLVAIAVLPFYFAWAYFQPLTFTLSGKEWECTSSYEHRVFTGKVWVNRTDCSQYSRKGIDSEKEAK